MGKRLNGRHVLDGNVILNGSSGSSAMDWIELDQIVDRWLALVNAVMKFRGSIKCVDFFLTNSESVSCSRRTRLYSLI